MNLLSHSQQNQHILSRRELHQSQIATIIHPLKLQIRSLSGKYPISVNEVRAMTGNIPYLDELGQTPLFSIEST